jgi:ATP-dependent DNA helicase RecG
MNVNENQILELIRRGEGLDLEFKTCRNQINRDVYETVCAFLNRHGKKYGDADPMFIEGDVFRMIIRVPEFGADISSQTSVGQDTPPVNMYVRRLLELLESSGSLGNAEILTAFKLKDRRRLRETYIAPALGSGVIAYTIPEKPRSSNQKYRLTEKGRKILKILS